MSVDDRTPEDVTTPADSSRPPGSRWRNSCPHHLASRLGAGLLTLIVLASCSSSPDGPQQDAAPRQGATTQVSAQPSTAPATGRHTFLRLPSPSGRLLETWLAGARSGVRLKVWVWLPPQYDDPAYAHTAFPALMLYPGGSGADRNAWVGTALGAQQAVVTGSRTGRISPFVLVMPAMQVSDSLDTECADLPGQPKVGTFLTQDVRALILKEFRVIRDRAGWGAAGTSSGAYCASRLVFDHPDQYTAVASIAGYFTIATPLRGAQSPQVRRGDPAQVARTSPPDVSVLLCAGTPADIRIARNFMAKIRAPTRAQLWVQPGAKHLTVDFARAVPTTLEFLTTRLNHPQPLATR